MTSLARLGLGTTLLIFTLCLCGSVAVAAGGQQQQAQKPRPTCATAKALHEAGETEEARKTYVAVLTADPSSKCAKNALEQINTANPNTVQANCDRGDRYQEADRDADAVAAYKSALEKDPGADCATEGLNEIPPEDATASSFLDDALTCLADALVLCGLALLALFLFLMLGYLPWVGNRFRRLWGVRRLLAPRLTIAALSDDAVDGKPGAPFSDRVKERLNWMRAEALAEGRLPYDLDFGRPAEDFADVVSDSSGLRSSLTQAGEVSAQTKVVAALLNLAYAALPIRRFAISGSVEPPSRAGAAVTMLLEKNARLKGAITLRDRAEPAPSAPDYVRLADSAAVWAQYETARAIDNEAVRLGAAESWALVREGLDHYTRGDLRLARTRYEEAAQRDRGNPTAYIGVALIEACNRRFPRSIEILREARREMRAAAAERGRISRWRAELQSRADRWLGRPPNPIRNAPYLADVDFYRLEYQLAAQQLHAALSPSGPRRIPAKSLKRANRLLEQAQMVSEWYGKRSKAGWWRFWIPKPSRREERLRWFLEGTVCPCLTLLLAASAKLQSKPVEATADPAAAIRAMARKHLLSYRGHYALACWEAEAGNADEALRSLRRALRQAPTERRLALFRWAKKDPSLSALDEKMIRMLAPALGIFTAPQVRPRAQPSMANPRVR